MKRRDHRVHHFRIEEEILLPGWVAGDSTADGRLPAQVADEHLEIRISICLIEADEPSRCALQELGELLERHVRFEERELFPQIEAGLDARTIVALGERSNAPSEQGAMQWVVVFFALLAASVWVGGFVTIMVVTRWPEVGWSATLRSSMSATRPPAECCASAYRTRSSTSGSSTGASGCSSGRAWSCATGSRSASISRSRSCAKATMRCCSRSAPASSAAWRSPAAPSTGVQLAMSYLYERNRAVAWAEGRPAPTATSEPISAAGKRVVVIGGGDTGDGLPLQRIARGSDRRAAVRRLPPRSRPGPLPGIVPIAADLLDLRPVAVIQSR